MSQIINDLPGKSRWQLHADYRNHFGYTSRDTLRRRISRGVITQTELDWALTWIKTRKLILNPPGK